MEKFVVENKKDGQRGVATLNKDGKYSITFDKGGSKTVAKTTFKRWYKVIEEYKEEGKNVDDVKVNVSGKSVPQKQSEAKQPAVKKGDYVELNGEFGRVQAVVGKLATVLVFRGGEVVEEAGQVGKLKTVKPAGQKGIKEIDKVWGSGNKPVEKKEVKKEDKKPEGKKEDKKPEPKKATPRKKEVPDSKLDQKSAAKFVQDNWKKGIQMDNRDVGLFKSKYGERPKFFDTFYFFGLRLEVTYINGVGSTECKLYDNEGKLITKAYNGTLKPVMEFLKFNQDQMKEVRQIIRDLRKGANEEQEKGKQEVKKGDKEGE